MTPVAAAEDEPPGSASDLGAGESPSGKEDRGPVWPWLGLAAGCVVADLWTKTAVFYPECIQPGFRPGLVVGQVAPWWRTVLVYNQGITFGMFREAGPWVLALFTAVVIVILVRMLLLSPRRPRLRKFALSIVIGGAVGNLYDRTLRPAVERDRTPGVRDFLDWYVPSDTALGQWLVDHEITTHWYTSNVADVLIVSGVILLAWCILREPEESDGTPESPGSPGPALERTRDRPASESTPS